jgi:hypothetical protein
MLLVVNMQVSTVVAGPYSHHSTGRADAGTATQGLTALLLVYLSQRNEPCILPIDGVLGWGMPSRNFPDGLILDT